MGRSRFDQDTQVWKSGTYNDTIAPTEANYETNTVSLENDLNCLRSMASELRDVRAGNWWDALAAPATFPGEGAAARGVQDVNEDLYDLQRKRILRRRAVVGANCGPVATNAQHEVLNAAGELPGNTTAAVGAVTTRGTVVASVAGAFDAPSLNEVAGSSTIQPKNLVLIVDTVTGDPILSPGGKEIFGLIQTEIATDGHTINTTTQRAQISFVVRNDTFDDLVLITAGWMDGKSFDYSPVERYAFEDTPEQSWLGEDFIDVGAGSATRQSGYDNQGTTPVDLITNATLDLEGAGLVWAIRDDLEANLFTITEGSAGGTSTVGFGAAVDVFNNDAVVNDFAGPLTVDDDGTAIEIGVTTGQINTTGTDDLELQAGGELYLDDGNRTGSTWATDGIKLSDTTAEWDDFETEFGEVSLFNAILQAYQKNNKAKAHANVITGDISANTLIIGSGGGQNISVAMPSYKGLDFEDDVEVFINGQLQRPGVDASTNNDVYPSAVAIEQAAGAFYCEYTLKYRGGSDPDVVQMIVWGEPTP